MFQPFSRESFADLGLKVNSFTTYDSIKKYETSEDGQAIKKGSVERTINIYAEVSAKFDI